MQNLQTLKKIATRGPITSDHLIRTKSVPAIIDQENPQRSLDEFSSAYKAYFERHTNGEQKCLDSAPRWAVWPGHGTIAFGANLTESGIVSDIAEHTVKAIQLAENLTAEGFSGGWQPVSEKHLFEAEYWVLQQAKLKSENVNQGEQKTISEFQGKIAIVSGAASGIGLACARELFAQGAVVVGLDLNPEISKIFCDPGMLGLQCDVTDQKAVIEAVAEMTLTGICSVDGVITGSLASRSSRIVAQDRTFSYVLYEGSTVLRITQKDVRAIQLAKAALYAGIQLLMDHSAVKKVDRIRLAGAFGSHIDVKYAMVLGLIPDCDLANVTSAGNAAGTGAHIALVDQNARLEIEREVRRIDKIETAVEPKFQEHFVEAMAIPHKTAEYPELSSRRCTT